MSLEVVESAMPLVQPIRVRVSRAAPVAMDYWTGGGPTLRVQSPAGGTHDLLLTRLRPERDYSFRVVGTERTGSFRSGSLPDDLAAIGFAPTGAPTVPLVLVHLFADPGFRGYAIVDGTGTVVWFRRTDDFPFGMARRANGNFVFMDRGRGLLEVTPGGVVLREVSQDTAGREMHHDVIATPDNTLLFIAHDRREPAGAPVRGEAIWEWAPESGALTKRWSSWDHLSVDADRGPRFGTEWMHANSLAIGPRGNVLLSVHYFNQIISIAPDWSGLEWRLGGVNATAALRPGDEFSGQHTAREIAPGRVLVFDNGLDRGGPSRAVEFEMTEGGVETRWEWLPGTGNFASAVGSARRLANGNTLVAFGMSAGLNGSTGPAEVWEVTAGGSAVWRLGVSGVRTMFRAEPLESVGGETILHPVEAAGAGQNGHPGHHRPQRAHAAGRDVRLHGTLATAVSVSRNRMGPAVDRMLRPVARAAAELLTSPARDRVRECGSDTCGWLFLDESRNRTRRWCDMKVAATAPRCVASAPLTPTP